MGVNPEAVCSLCLFFLAEYFGCEGEPPDDGTGFRLICLGNAEQTLQGELLCFLRSELAHHGFTAVSECGASDFGQGRLNPDIVIFDGHWQPVCLIEIKHYSANQGSNLVVQNGLIADHARFEDVPLGDIPFIPLALYTEITACGELPIEYSLYRFVRSWWRGEAPAPNRFAGGPLSIIRPAKTSISVGGCEIVGRVGYWVGEPL